MRRLAELQTEWTRLKRASLPAGPARQLCRDRGQADRRAAPAAGRSREPGPGRAPRRPSVRVPGRRAAPSRCGPGAAAGSSWRDWLTHPDHPLTARVMVNRIWQHHFGRGIVATPSNFGIRGEPPTHPELLDWLAARFVASGWSIKAMHREIVLSETYQLASDHDPASASLDPENRWLWRFPRRRLDAESIRDAMLAVSDGSTEAGPGRTRSRRSRPGTGPSTTRSRRSIRRITAAST